MKKRKRHGRRRANRGSPPSSSTISARLWSRRDVGGSTKRWRRALERLAPELYRRRESIVAEPD